MGTTRSPPSDPRMREEMKILGGSYQSLALRCWKNSEKEDTSCFAYVIMWLKNGKLKATKIKHENLETKSEWQDRNDNADSYMEAMFIQFPKVARMAEKLVHTLIDHGAKDHDDFADLNLFLFAIASEELERMHEEKENPKYRVDFVRL